MICTPPDCSGAARVLCDLRSEFSGCVKLVFQPAEEDVLDSGAVKMIEDGVLENPKVDAMFGQHIWPYYPVGKVAIRDGAMMASSDRFHITIRGKASHGSAPESGIDAIAAAAQVISALQTIVSRRVSRSTRRWLPSGPSTAARATMSSRTPLSWRAPAAI